MQPQVYAESKPFSVLLLQAVSLEAIHSSRRVAVVLSFLLLLAALARFPHLNGQLNDLDAWRQTDTASIAHLFLDQPNILYPRVFWGNPPGYVEAEFQLYPWAVSLIYRVLGENPLYGRLLSITLGLLSVLILYRIARRYLPVVPSVAAAGFFAFAPVFFRYSRQFMPEATMLFFYLLALERFLAFLEEENWPHLLQSAAALCLAILIKPTSIQLGLALMILCYVQWGWRFIYKIKLLVFAAISLIPSALYYVHAMHIYFTYGNTFGVISGGDSKWTSMQQFLSFHFYHEMLRMDTEWILGWGGAVLALLGLVIYRRPRWRPLLWAWGISFALYCLLLGRSTGDQGRGLQYHIFAAPLIALAAGGGATVLIGMQRHWGLLLALLICAAIGGKEVYDDYHVLGSFVQPWQYNAGERLAQLSKPDERVVVLSEDVVIDHDRPNNYQEPKVFFYAKRWGRSLGRDQQTAPGLADALNGGAQWYVNFPAFNNLATPGFFRLIQSRMNLAAQGTGYQIYRVLPPARLPNATHLS